jgi:predicted RNA-binding Zn-ribbon protein involved in translation (DUF1610 family)
VLTECPDCGTAVDTPFKSWSVSRKSQSALSGKTKTEFGIFDCPDCGNRFRAGLKKSPRNELSIKGAVEKIKGIEGEFVGTLKSLREKLKTLETERGNLLLEIDGLKKMAEDKANALESEVGMLREEVQSLKQLLGVDELET